MSVATTDLTKGIRVDQATQKGSVNDVIARIAGKKGSYAIQVFSRIKQQYTGIIPKCDRLKINGKGNITPVADAATLIELAWLCPGHAAAAFRRKGAESVCRMLGGDLSLVDEIQRRHAQVAGTAEESFLLTSTQGATQTAVQGLPYTLEHLQQMQAAAEAIVASKDSLQQSSVVLHEFPISKYSQYIDLRGKEVHLKEKDLDIDCRRFGLRQQEDEHGLRMDRERAELQDRSAKRMRFNAGTEDGVTFRCLLAKAAEGVGDAKGFEEKARQLSLGLEVYNAFKDHITGSHKTLQYDPAAADAIAKFITESVKAGSNNAATKDLRSYFNALPRESVDTGNLYSP